jgi:5'-phosphate synthase pdxT subunit
MNSLRVADGKESEMNIGVLALQGAFIEHIQILQTLGVNTRKVRLPEELNGLDGLIIPGGESTTIGKLSVWYDLGDSIRRFASQKAIWGTCAGMIVMAKDIGMDQPLLGIMDIVVKRNAFGRQTDSFQTDLYIPALKDGKIKSFPAIFIRAPKLEQVGANTDIIAKLDDGTAVAARQGKMLVTSFHPELTQDTRFHEYFISLAK